MRLPDLTSPELIFPDVPGKDAASVLRALARNVVATGSFSDSDELFSKLWEREQLGSTGIGHGVAVPHCRLERVERVIVSLGRNRRGVPFGAVDKKPVQLFFLVIAPENAAAAYLECLREISRLVKDEERVALMVAENDPARLFRLLDVSGGDRA